MKIVLRESACEGKATGRQTRSILENTWSATGSPWGREWDGRMSENCWVTIDSLISKTQMNLQAKQEKQLSQFFPSASSHLLESRSSTSRMVPREGKQNNPKSSLFAILPSTSIDEHIIWYRISCWSVWVSCPIWVPSQPIPWGKQNHYSVQALLKNGQNKECYWHCSSHELETAPDRTP